MAVRSASVTCVTWATASSLSLDPLPSDEPPADVVVANILLNPLLALQDTITGLVKVGGTQVMSGIRLDQADRVIAAYGPKFDDVRVAKETDGWLVVVASGRKAD